MSVRMESHADSRPSRNSYTAREAAAALNLSERTIRRAIRHGELTATKWGGVFQIAPGELARFRAERRGEAVSTVAPASLTRLPSRQLALRSSSIPTPLTPMIGRSGEVAVVLGLLQSPKGPRLVVLTGPGGVGKTRLAIAVAEVARETFADGVIVIPLASIRDPALVPMTIANALRLGKTDEQELEDQLALALAHAHLLLVLDNFEQVVEAAPCLGRLLSACPRLVVLVTSRSRLHLSGEHLVPVLPLAVEAPGHDLPSNPQGVSPAPAVELFLARAQAIHPSFQVTDENRTAVVEICRRLEGLPLAIELAAARIAVLPPEGLLARLDHRLPVLVEGPRDLPARLRTMRDAIAWSYDLLTAEEQRFFRRLAVCAGGFTLDAAEALAGADEPPGSQSTTDQAPEVVLLVESLIDKSLLRRVEAPKTGPRYDMLEVIREFGLDQLSGCGELDAARQRHAEHFLAIAEASDQKLRGPDQVRRLAMLEADHDNLRAALTWSLTVPGGDIAVRLVGALHWFWYLRDHAIEGRKWHEAALAQAAMAEQTPARVKALAGAGLLAQNQLRDHAATRRWLEQSKALARVLDDRRGLAYALHLLVWLDLFQADHGGLRSSIEDSVALYREAGDQWGLATALCTFGMVMIAMSEPATANLAMGESLILARELGDTWGLARALHYAGEVARARREYERACALYEECLGFYRELEHHGSTGNVLNNLGGIALQQGEFTLALAYLAAALAEFLASGDHQNFGYSLGGVAGAAALLGRPEQAARLFGAADALFARLDLAVWPVDRDEYEPARELARTHLGEAAFASAYEAGRAIPLDHAIAEATAILASLASAAGPAAAAEHRFGLTRREGEILRLVANHATDREIAAQLSISPRTVMHHVSSILAKLGVSNRRSAALLAADLDV